MNRTAIVVLVVVVLGGFLMFGPKDENIKNQDLSDGSTYNPEISPSDFVSSIDNKYFSLTPGKKMVYKAKKKEGVEIIEFYVTNEKRVVMGIETTVVWDRVWLNDELIEDTKDWFAQDKEGNVWYFGEETYELENGVVVNSNGAWEAGIDGAKPGVVMRASPQVGDVYRQEYYKDIAEDAGEILAVGETITVPFGILKDCIRTRDFTPLDPSANENKIYCSEVGGVALEIDMGDDEKTELVSVEYNSQPSSGVFSKSPAENVPPPQSNDTAKKPDMVSKEIISNVEITEQKAKEIALEKISGEVTDVSIEQKSGVRVYVVEVATSARGEVDVVIDMKTGEILVVED